MLCRHVLNVFLHKNCYHIPPLYLSSRWFCEASLSEKELLVLDDKNLVGKENVVDANVNSVNNGDCFINCLPLLKTKGCPKQKQMKDEKELGKKKKTCEFCKHVGHNISKCLEEKTCTSLNGPYTSSEMGFYPIILINVRLQLQINC